MSLAWVDGRFLPAARAIAADDAAFLAGHGLFETIGAAGGRLPLWDHHLARLVRGAARLQIHCEPPAGLRASAEELLSRTSAPDGILRLCLSAGSAGGQRPRWIATVRARPPAGAVRLAVASEPLPDDWPFATIKISARPHYALAFAAARATGADDALLLDRRGLVQETTTGNLFAEIGGELVTPRESGRFLPGIARALLLAALPVREVELTLDELEGCAGLWVTNAVHGPRPAVVGAAGTAAVGAGALAGAWARILAGR